MHGGCVQAESGGAGRGSTFSVRLPLLAEQSNVLTLSVQETAPAHLAPRGGPLRILVVDDNEDSAQSMSALLKLQGHEVALADAGRVALAAAQDTRPDVILLDIGMPDMNGYEVARQLRSQTSFSDTLLVAVTGYGRPSDVQQTQAAGFDHHLVKPIDYDKLESLLDATARRLARHNAPHSENQAVESGL
jgi:two-component system CheB/CheR fusion protein